MTIFQNHPIKVAMIIQEYFPHLGGAEKQLSALAPLLKERGVELYILTRRYPGLAQYELIDEVPVYRLPILSPKALASLIFTFTALSVLNRLKPSIIHAHGLLSPTTTAVIAKRWLGIPVVSKSLRGGILGDLIRLMNKPLGPSRFHLLQKHVDAFIAISNEIKNELIESGISPERCIFIPNGVNLDEFQPATQYVKNRLRKQLGLPEGPLVIFVGRLEPEKRVDNLVQVWLEIRRQYADAHLLILGTGTQEERLKQMAAGSVLFRGVVDNVATYLQTADLFVLPSVSEGLSNALLEALATGLPVVVTATGGTTDIVRHKVSGWLIQDYTPRNLLAGILAFLDNKPLREGCAREGRRFVLENYSLINTADNLCKLYNSLLAR
jgi:glycosyltransferase involved in cell wall biosynthesis